MEGLSEQVLLSLSVLVGRLHAGQTVETVGAVISAVFVTAGTVEAVNSPQVLGLELVGCEGLGKPAQ